MVSLRLSCAAIVHLLEITKQNDALQLLFFLGHLPGGATPELLDKVWNDKGIEWRKEITVL